jgi:hypothetical protein
MKSMDKEESIKVWNLLKQVRRKETELSQTRGVPIEGCWQNSWV